jgi:hypothetical protein
MTMTIMIMTMKMTMKISMTMIVIIMATRHALLSMLIYNEATATAKGRVKN